MKNIFACDKGEKHGDKMRFAIKKIIKKKVKYRIWARV